MDIAELIARLAELHQEALALEKELEKPAYIAPRHGAWSLYPAKGFLPAFSGCFRPEWDKYNTQAATEWQVRAEEARRKAQQLVKALAVPVGSTSFPLYSGGIPTGLHLNTIAQRDEVIRQMGPDLEYLNWYNSPEYKEEE